MLLMKWKKKKVKSYEKFFLLVVVMSFYSAKKFKYLSGTRFFYIESHELGLLVTFGFNEELHSENLNYVFV